MLNPKQSLHSFSRIYQAKNTPSRSRSSVFGEFAMQLANANVVHETDALALQQAQQLYSLSTIEELAALARIDQREGTSLFSDLGLSESTRERVVTTLESLEEGREMLQEMERYENIRYRLGCELDFSTPPAEEDFLAPVAINGVVFGAGAPVLEDPQGKTIPSAKTSKKKPKADPLGTVPPLPADVNLIDQFMPPIKDQADRGTCVAFTTATCLEYFLGRFGSQPGLDLSEQFQYWNMITKTKQSNLVSGFPLLKKSGICREQTWPYYGQEIPHNHSQGPAPQTSLSEASAYCCKNHRQFSNPRAILDLKDALSRGRLVGIGIPVYRSWFKSGAVRQYGNITLPLPGEVPENVGHAITLVGYSDNPEFAGGGYFILRNSWGHVWGTNNIYGSGYGTIPYRYISHFNWDAWCIVS